LSGRAFIRVAAAAAALALVATGCGSSRKRDEERIRGSRLTIYGSAPLEGPDRDAAADVVRGERLALAQAGGRVGRYDVRFVALDAATPKARSWDPAQISQNARRAANDPAAIAYLGELDNNSSAISIPLLNEAGVLEVSPLDTAMALTTHSRAVAGSPERYYPNLREAGRTFARLVPNDRVQAAALVQYMAGEGVRRVALLVDEDTTALALAEVVRAGLPEAGIALAADEAVDGDARDHRDLVQRVLAQRPDAVLYAGGAHDLRVRVDTERLWRELAAAAPGLKLFAPDTLADPRFLSAIGVAGEGTYVTRPVLALSAYPPPARRFARTFATRYGARPAPEALYGYEAMRGVLAATRSAVRAAGAGTLTRTAVAHAFFGSGRLRSVLGTYAIDAHGDTSLTTYGAYRVVDGRLRYERALVG
jgi:branched-chain amino acid transport system substrate-binding protein